MHAPVDLSNLESKSIWNLYEDGVSQSFIHRFRACRLQAFMAYCEGWTSLRETLPMETGTAIQDILCTLYKQTAKEIPSEERVLHVISKYEKRWKRGRGILSQTSDNLIEMVCLFCESTLPGYCKKWKSDWGVNDPTLHPQYPRIKKWIGLEKRFEVSLSHSTLKSTIPITGSFDGVFEDFKCRVWLLETKNKGQVNESEIVDTLGIDLQVMLYLWALKQQGLKVHGVVYNVVRRPGQRLGKKESLSKFTKRIHKDVAERPDHYFHRWFLRVTASELNEWFNYIFIPIMAEIETWWLRHCPSFCNDDALRTKYGKSDFFDAIVNGDYGSLVKRTVAHKELTEKETN